MEAQLRKDSVKGCEKNYDLSLRTKRDCTKAGNHELEEKLRKKNIRVFRFSRESIRDEDVDTEDTEE